MQYMFSPGVNSWDFNLQQPLQLRKSLNKQANKNPTYPICLLIGTGIIWVLSQIVKADVNCGTSLLLDLPWLQIHALTLLFSSMSVGVVVWFWVHPKKGHLKCFNLAPISPVFNCSLDIKQPLWVMTVPSIAEKELRFSFPHFISRKLKWYFDIYGSQKFCSWSKWK